MILNQQRAIGASPDWDYSIFTMDPDSNDAVRKVFVDLYNEGLIYQSDYIVNWDPVLQSAISDAEVEFKEVEGAFYHLHYDVVGSDEVLELPRLDQKLFLVTPRFVFILKMKDLSTSLEKSDRSSL